MSAELRNEIVSTIIQRTLGSVPTDLESYRNPAGRKPSDAAKRVAAIMEKLTDDEAIALIRDITDSAVFGIFYLLDNDFKNRNIKTTFRKGDIVYSSETAELLETYRGQIDPGGFKWA